MAWLVAASMAAKKAGVVPLRTPSSHTCAPGGEESTISCEGCCCSVSVTVRVSSRSRLTGATCSANPARRAVSTCSTPAESRASVHDASRASFTCAPSSSSTASGGSVFTVSEAKPGASRAARLPARGRGRPTPAAPRRWRQRR